TLSLAPSAHGDIFQWEYINPGNPSQGKQQSTTLCVDGAGVSAVPAADLSSRNLTMAYLIARDLTSASLYRTNLTNADLSAANLTSASFFEATLTGANFTGANVRWASFDPGSTHDGTGLTGSQLYSTASYQAHDLTGIQLPYQNLNGLNFQSQNLTDAVFS